MHILHEPSFFLTKTIGDPHGDVLGLLNPFSSSFCTCFLIFAFSKADNPYIPILGNGASCCKLISCTISFLGVRPLGSWNSISYYETTLSKSTSCLALQPSNTLVLSSFFSFTTISKNCLHEFTILFMFPKFMRV